MGGLPRRAIALVLVLLVAPLGAAGCTGPTLPLPPPEAELSGPPDAQGEVTVTGQARERALVFVLNQDLERGVIVAADDLGAFTARVAAQSGHTITVWQREGTDDGQPVSLTVP